MQASQKLPIFTPLTSDEIKKIAQLRQAQEADEKKINSLRLLNNMRQDEIDSINYPQDKELEQEIRILCNIDKEKSELHLRVRNCDTFISGIATLIESNIIESYTNPSFYSETFVALHLSERSTLLKKLALATDPAPLQTGLVLGRKGTL